MKVGRGYGCRLLLHSVVHRLWISRGSSRTQRRKSPQRRRPAPLRVLVIPLQMWQKDMFERDPSTAGSSTVRVLESSRMAQLAPVASVAADQLQAAVTPEEMAWAAGLFEGEGSLALGQRGNVRLSIASTDRDVIDRFRAAIGTGRLSSQAPGGNRRRKRL